MSSEFGFSSPLWMAKAVVAYAPEFFIRKAIVEVLDLLWREAHEEEGEMVSAEEVFERVIQVAVLGEYVGNSFEINNVDLEFDEDWGDSSEEPPSLTPEQQTIMEKFRKILGIDDDEVEDE